MTLDPVSGTSLFWGFGDNTYGEMGTTPTVGIGNDTSGGLTNQVSQYTPAGPLQFCTRCERCVQLGTGGVFTAQCNGTLYLYFNGDLTNSGASFQDYGGSYAVSLTGAGLTNSQVTVLATNYQGLAVCTVTVGNTYTFTASGYCTNDSRGYQVDANGALKGTTNLVSCAPSPYNFNYNKTDSVCPSLQCFSLVGKIQ